MNMDDYGRVPVQATIAMSDNKIERRRPPVGERHLKTFR